MMQIKSNLIKSIFLLICILFSCANSNDRNDAIIRTLDSLSQSFNKDTLNIAISKLDSVLSYDENKTNGYFYYKRGYCHTVLRNYEKAIRDLEISRKAGYKPEKSSELIEYNKGLKENESKYAPYN